MVRWKLSLQKCKFCPCIALLICIEVQTFSIFVCGHTAGDAHPTIRKRLFVTIYYSQYRLKCIWNLYCIYESYVLIYDTRCEHWKQTSLFCLFPSTCLIHLCWHIQAGPEYLILPPALNLDFSCLVTFMCFLVCFALSCPYQFFLSLC